MKWFAAKRNFLRIENFQLMFVLFCFNNNRAFNEKKNYVTVIDLINEQPFPTDFFLDLCHYGKSLFFETKHCYINEK